jgi:pantetheine-phosphate adenylyltransferase
MSKELRVGVYPGTFDPVTRGHLDIISRATRVVDRLILGVAINEDKGPLFSLDERVALLAEELKSIKNRDGSAIEVKPFDNLLTQFATSIGASVVIRGLRAVSDFEFEFQMVGMNSRLAPDVETVFLMAADKYQFISSRLVKEIGRLGGDVSEFVSPGVCEKLIERFKQK